MAERTQFEVRGPFKVPREGTEVARRLVEFWDEVDAEGEVSSRRGVYIFAMQAGRGITPIYVGKASKTQFRTEAFAGHKRGDHYNPALLAYKRGTPVMFFVLHPLGPGRVGHAAIDEIETFLIGLAWKKNPDLSNVRKKPRETWEIKGVYLASRGQPTNSAKKLRATLGI